MSSIAETRARVQSHKDYLDALHLPTEEEARRISEIQLQREGEIDRKYHSEEEHNAATKIQRAYRGHRARRQLDGLTLDPSARWTDIIREWRFRRATAPQYGPSSARVGSDGRPRAPSDMAKLNWHRAGYIAEHAGGGDDRSPTRGAPGSTDLDSVKTQDEVNTMLLDMRYWLEMVDQKHRYGANLLVYHEEWLRSKTDQNFFYWLDRGDGKHLDLPGCSREKLDKERIRYLSKDERRQYLVQVDQEGKLRWSKNNELITTSVEKFKDSMDGIVLRGDEKSPSFTDEDVARQLAEERQFVRQMARTQSSDRSGGSNSSEDSSSLSEEAADDGTARKTKKRAKKSAKRFHVSPATILNQLLRASVKPGTWIYVADTVGRLYVGIKASGAFQHASFLSGARISSAGSIGIENGQLTYLSPLSGHYRPTTKTFRAFINALTDEGVDMSHVRVSNAFEILLAMEYYGKTKKDARKFLNRRKDDKQSNQRKSSASDGQRKSPQTEALTPSGAEGKKQKEHTYLGKLMDDLHIRRRSFDGS